MVRTRVDWHGHSRGFGLGNALSAIEAGADRVHGTIWAWVNVSETRQ